jgi:DHA1 family tetracycline resistance protein-like MFS transporter
MMKFHHPAVPIVLSAAMIDAIGFGIVMPVLPRLIVELGGVTLADAARIGGYMLATYAITQFFAGPVLGNIGDAFGRRRVILFSMIAFSIDYAMMAWAPTLAWLFLGRAIAGAAGAIFGPANAVLADVTPPEKRAATFGLMGAAFGSGFVLGPAIGGLLADLGPRAPFIVASVLAGLNAIWIFFALPETITPERRRTFDIRQAHIFGAFKPLLSAGGIAGWLLLAVFLWQFAHMVYPATWAYWGEIALGWDEKTIGLSLAMSGLCMVLVQMLVISRAIKRFGEGVTAMLGVLAGALVFTGYIFVQDGGFVWPLLAFGALQALAYPSMNALLSRMTEASRQGSLQGGMSSLMSMVLIIAPLATSQSLAFGAERGFTGGGFLLAATLAFASLAILLIFVLPKIRLAPAPVAEAPAASQLPGHPAEDAT